MDRQTLLDALRDGGVEIALNDGDRVKIPSREFCVVDDSAAHVLYRDAAGKYRTKIVSLVCMTSISPIQGAAG